MSGTRDPGGPIERLPDPWQQVDASGEADRLIEVLEGADATSGWADLQRRWLDFADVRPGDHVLDIGCGTGVVARDLVRRVGERGKVVGIDPSTRFIEEAGRRARDLHLENQLAFRVADGAALPFPDWSFDLVVASAVFGHIPNALEVLKEMTRVARSGGRVVAFDHDIDTFVINAADRGLTRRIVHAYCDRYFTSGWAGRELYGLFRQEGLEEIEVLSLTHVSSGFDAYWQRMVERLTQVAVKTQAVSVAEAAGWRADLEGKGRDGLFFASRSYFCLRGRKPGAIR